MILPATFGDYLPSSELRDSLKRAKSGDRAAFECIIRPYERLVLRTAQRLLDSPTDAQDAAQEVFLRLFRSLASFHDDRDFAPWLYRVTVNICHDLRRRRPKSIALEAVPPMADPASNPEGLLSAAQRNEQLHRALERLPEKERAAIVLRDLEGLPTAQVALILQSTEATVRSQISSGRLKLRHYLKGERRRS